MSSKKRLSRAVALLLIVAMLIPMTLVSATAETPATPKSIDDYLTIHWDFEGETLADALKDKATKDGVATDLQVPQEADYAYSGNGTAANPYVLGDVADDADRMKNSISVVNGMITPNNADGYVYATPTADTEGVFQSAEGGTWFFRYKLPNNYGHITNRDGAALIDFRSQNGGRPLYIQMNSNNTVHAYPANVAKESCTTWTAEQWETLVVRYERVSDTNHCYAVYKINDDLSMTRVAYAPGCSKPVSAEGVYLSLFRHINEEVGYGTPEEVEAGTKLTTGGTTDKWSGFGGWYIDDVRYYNIALTDAQVTDVVCETITDSHLTMHYDFEGATTPDKLADKAIAGASTDNLYIPTDKDANATEATLKFSNGAVTALNDYSVLMLNGAAPTTDSKAMFQNKISGSTFFIRFQMNNRTFSKALIPVDLRNTATNDSRPLHIQWENGKVMQINVPDGTSVQDTKGLVTTNTWVNLMYRMEGTDSTTGTSTYSVYLVTKNSTTFIASYSTKKTPDTSTLVLTFFREWQENKSAFPDWAGSRELTIDDVRYYDTAISNGMAQAIVKDLATTVNYDEHLILHYDFEGEGDEALKDKATAGTAEDNLTVSGGTFTIVNGVATADSKDSGMKAASSADTQTIFDKDNYGTWFFRYKNPAANWADGYGNAVIIDFRNTNNDVTTTGRPFFYQLEKTNNLANSLCWNVGFQKERFSWAEECWVNVAVIYKGKNASGHNIFATVEIYEDGGEWKVRSLRTDFYFADSEAHSPETVELSLFREWSESTSTFATWSGLKDLSIDDVRYYNTALDSDDLIGILESENGFEQVNTLGVQKGTGTDADTTKVRLVSEIRGIDFKNAGYKVQLSYTDGDVLKTSELTDLSVSTAYKALNADGSAIAAIKPFEGYYLIAVVIDNIPASAADLKITFTPYAANANGTVYEGVTAVYDHATGTVAKA